MYLGPRISDLGPRTSDDDGRRRTTMDDHGRRRRRICFSSPSNGTLCGTRIVNALAGIGFFLWLWGMVWSSGCSVMRCDAVRCDAVDGLRCHRHTGRTGCYGHTGRTGIVGIRIWGLSGIGLRGCFGRSGDMGVGASDVGHRTWGIGRGMPDVYSAMMSIRPRNLDLVTTSTSNSILMVARASRTGISFDCPHSTRDALLSPHEPRRWGRTTISHSACRSMSHPPLVLEPDFGLWSCD